MAALDKVLARFTRQGQPPTLLGLNEASATLFRRLSSPGGASAGH